MENEELAEGQPRVAQYMVENASKDKAKGEEAIKTVEVISVNDGTPLLGQRKASNGDNSSPPPPNAWYDPQFEGLPWYRRPSIGWMVVPFLAVAIAYGGIIVTKLTLIQDLLCDEYFSSKLMDDPTFTFMPIVLGKNNEQCGIPEVSSLTSEFMVVASLLSGLPAAIVAPVLGAYSDRWGRTRVLALTSLGSIVGEIITILIASFPQTISVRWILLGYFFEGISGSFIVSMAIANAYASDCTPPQKRARAISFIYGCLFGGIAFGPLLSAFLVEKTGNMVTPFWLALVVHVIFVAFMAFLVPESVPIRRQMSAREAWYEAKVLAGPEARWKELINLPKALKILWPTGAGSSSLLRRNLVLLAAVDTVCFGVAMGAMTVVLVYSRQAFDWDHSTTQYYTSLVNVCRVVVLLAILPLANRILRGRSGPDRKQGHTGADNIDLGLIRAGVLFDMVGFIGFAAANKGSAFMLSGAIASAGGIVSPTLSSAVTRHLPAQFTGQILGAIGLLHALARVVSPAIFNGIFAATTKSFPQTVFVCLASAFGVAELLSWFVKPNVYYNEQLVDDEEIERPRSPGGQTLLPDDEEDSL